MYVACCIHECMYSEPVCGDHPGSHNNTISVDRWSSYRGVAAYVLGIMYWIDEERSLRTCGLCVEVFFNNTSSTVRMCEQFCHEITQFSVSYVRTHIAFIS